MKKVILFINILLFSISAAASSDVTVTATASVSPPGNNGSLLVEIDISNLPPFMLTITGPFGLNVTQTISSHTFSLNGLAPGVYCVKVVNTLGCETTVCAEVQNCSKSPIGNTYLCSVTPNDCCRDALFITGNPNSFDGNNVPSGFNFEAYHILPVPAFEAISNSILTKSLAFTNQIIQTGSTPYDVATQYEIESDAMFIYKFDMEGNLIWAYHKYNPLGSGERSSTLTKKANLEIEMFPNPTSGDINLQFQEGAYQSVSVIDINGKQKFYNLIKPNTTEIIVDGKNLSPGLYVIHFKTIENKSMFKRFVKVSGL